MTSNAWGCCIRGFYEALAPVAACWLAVRGPIGATAARRMALARMFHHQ
jgi:hypothetical protein